MERGREGGRKEREEDRAEGRVVRRKEVRMEGERKMKQVCSNKDASERRD